MKYLFFLLVVTASCAKQNLNAQNTTQVQLSYDYRIKAKLVGKSTLKDTYIFLFKDDEKSYKVLSDKECDFIIDNTYSVDLLLLKRPESMPPNLSIEHCVNNKRDKICTEIGYTHLYRLQSACNAGN